MEAPEQETATAIRPPRAAPAVVAICNQKGGVAKTTTAVNLAVCLAAFGARVVVVDFDAQGNASQALGAATLSGPGSYEVLSGKMTVEEALRETPVPGVSLIAATRLFALAEIETSFLEQSFENLKRALAALTGKAEIVVIDCAPTLGSSVVNAIAVTDSLLIPVTNDGLAFDGLKRTWTLATRVRNGLRSVSGILLVGRDEPGPREVLAEEMGVEMALAVYPISIPSDLSVVAAGWLNQPACLYDATSPAAGAYFDVAEHFLKRMRNHRLLPAGFEPCAKSQARETLLRWHESTAARRKATPAGLAGLVARAEPPQRPQRPNPAALIVAVLVAFAAGLTLGALLFSGLTPGELAAGLADRIKALLP